MNQTWIGRDIGSQAPVGRAVRSEAGSEVGTRLELVVAVVAVVVVVVVVVVFSRRGGPRWQ